MIMKTASFSTLAAALLNCRLICMRRRPAKAWPMRAASMTPAMFHLSLNTRNGVI